MIFFFLSATVTRKKTSFFLVRFQLTRLCGPSNRRIGAGAFSLFCQAIREPRRAGEEEVISMLIGASSLVPAPPSLPPRCSLCSPASTCCRIPKHSVSLLLPCSPPHPSPPSQPLFTSALFPPSLSVWFDEWSRWTVSSTSSAGRGKSLLAVSHQSEFRGGLSCFLSLSLHVVWRIRSQIRHNLAQKYIIRTPTAFRGRSRNSECKFHPCENGVTPLFFPRPASQTQKSQSFCSFMANTSTPAA